MLAGSEQSVIHLLWDTAEGGATSVPYSIVVEDAASGGWRFSRGKGLYARLRQWLQLGWWAGDSLNVPRLRRLLQAFPLEPRFAYIICMREWDARKALALWRAVGRPEYILHVMDVFHDRLTEAETPHFAELVRGARHVACISGAIEEEMKHCGARATSVLPCCTPMTAEGRQPLEPPLRVIISGAIWAEHYSDNPALSILAEAWEEIRCHHQGAELHYAGNAGDRLPLALKRIVVDHGRIGDAEYQRLLRHCNLAYLPVSHPPHTVGKFSVPSRLVDYLACGLPIITCAERGTSIASFMSSVPQTCTANICDTTTLIAAIQTFAASPERWAGASRDAAAFAKDKLSVDRVRSELFRLLHGVKCGEAEFPA
jgi:glycosyltransferase involved in cell wall biosynthesis